MWFGVNPQTSEPLGETWVSCSELSSTRAATTPFRFSVKLYSSWPKTACWSSLFASAMSVWTPCRLEVSTSCSL